MAGWQARTKTVALVAAVFVIATATWLWLQPLALVKLEFARQRLSLGLQRHDAQVEDHRWTWVERAADRADAPTLVMVHGFTGSKENWYPLSQRLKGRYRLVIPDLPGWGQSERKPDADYGFDAQGRRLAAFLRQVRRPGSPLVLLGHSMGGGIVAITAADEPELVARVGLFDAAGIEFTPNRFMREVLAGQNPFEVHDEASLRRYIDTVMYRADAKPFLPWPASRGVIALRRQQAPFEQKVLDAIGRGPEQILPGQAAAHIQQPALLLWCRQDAVIDPSAMQRYAAQIPQALQVLLDQCGHSSMMERPDASAAAVDYLITQGKPR